MTNYPSSGDGEDPSSAPENPGTIIIDAPIVFENPDQEKQFTFQEYFDGKVDATSSDGQIRFNGDAKSFTSTGRPSSIVSKRDA